MYIVVLNGTLSEDTIGENQKNVINHLLNRDKTYRGSESYRMTLLKRLVENETYRYLINNAITDYQQNEGRNK